MVAPLLFTSAAVLSVASAAYLRWLLRYDPKHRRVGVVATGIGTAALVGALGVELAADVAHLATPGRVMLIVAAGAALLFLLGRLWRDLPVAGAVVAPLTTVVAFGLATRALGAGVAADGATPESMAAVTAIHIGATILGFLLFVPSYVLSVLFLGQEYRLKTRRFAVGEVGTARLPGLMSLEGMAWRLLYVGFPLYSVGLILGAVWQDSVGDGGVKPQQVLAALGWAVFAVATYRHLRTGWRGRTAAITLMTGFVVTFGAVMLYAMR